MKKFTTFCLMVMVIVGCSGNIEFVPKTLSITDIDLTPYSNKGFLFSPYRYLGDYKSIGILLAKAFPEARYTSTRASEINTASALLTLKEWKINRVPIEESLDSLYSAAVKAGADAIVDLSFVEDTHTYNWRKPSQLKLYGYKIYGYAIKRLGAFKDEGGHPDPHGATWREGKE